jgi:hypothetical protein
MHLTYKKIRKNYKLFSGGKGMAKQVKSKPAFKRKKPGNRAFLVVSQKVLQIFAVVGGFSKRFVVCWF